MYKQVSMRNELSQVLNIIHPLCVTDKKYLINKKELLVKDGK
jgi:hypothetical protein